jgi:hypothetical protein
MRKGKSVVFPIPRSERSMNGSRGVVFGLREFYPPDRGPDLFIVDEQKERYWMALPSFGGPVRPKTLSRWENKFVDPKRDVKKTGCPYMKGKQFDLTIDMSPFPLPSFSRLHPGIWSKGIRSKGNQYK